MNNMIGEGLCISDQKSLTFKDAANQTKDKHLGFSVETDNLFETLMVKFGQ